MRRPPVTRLVALLALMIVAFGGIVVRLAFLQVRDNPELEALGFQQRVRSATLPAQRGEIVDRSGVPLAVTREARDIYVDPRSVVDAEAEADDDRAGARPAGGRRAGGPRGRRHLRLDRSTGGSRGCSGAGGARPSRHRLPRSGQAALPGGGARTSGARVRQPRWRRSRRARERLRRDSRGHTRRAHHRALGRRSSDLKRLRHGRAAGARVDDAHDARSADAVHGADGARARGDRQRGARRHRGRDGPGHRRGARDGHAIRGSTPTRTARRRWRRCATVR